MRSKAFTLKQSERMYKMLITYQLTTNSDHKSDAIVDNLGRIRINENADIKLKISYNKSNTQYDIIKYMSLKQYVDNYRDESNLKNFVISEVKEHMKELELKNREMEILNNLDTSIKAIQMEI